MILAIESSTKTGGLAVFDPDSGEVIFERAFVSDRAHNAVIFGPLREALTVIGAKPSLIVVGTGPGSYSGVRVGIAVANSLSVAYGVAVIGLPSIAGLEIEPDDYLVAGDARRGSFFLAEVRNRRVLAAPRVLDPEKFTAEIRLATIPVFSIDPKPPLDLEQIILAAPSAVRLAKLGATAPIVDSPIEPIYIREPYITKPKRRPSTVLG